MPTKSKMLNNPSPFEECVMDYLHNFNEINTLPEKIKIRSECKNDLVNKYSAEISLAEANEIYKVGNEVNQLKTILSEKQTEQQLLNGRLLNFMKFMPNKKLVVKFDDKNYELIYNQVNGILCKVVLTE